jgi:hypothetical protein
MDKSAVRQGRKVAGTQSRKAGLPIVTCVNVAEFGFLASWSGCLCEP